MLTDVNIDLSGRVGYFVSGARRLGVWIWRTGVFSTSSGVGHCLGEELGSDPCLIRSASAGELIEAWVEGGLGLSECVILNCLIAGDGGESSRNDKLELDALDCHTGDDEPEKQIRGLQKSSLKTGR